MLAKSKLNGMEVLISKAVNEFVLINSALREYNKIKEAIKNLKT